MAVFTVLTWVVLLDIHLGDSRPDSWVGLICLWLLGLAGGPLCIWFAVQSVDDSVQIRLSADGVYDRRWSDVTIPWTAINRISVYSSRYQRWIVLSLDEPEKYPPRRTLWRWGRGLSRRMTGGDIEISLQFTGANFKQTRASFEEFHRRYGVSDQAPTA